MTCRCRRRCVAEVEPQLIRHPALQGRRSRCFTSEKQAVTIVQGAGRCLRQSRSHGNYVLNRVSIPYRARSDPPYRLRYFGCHIL